MNNGRLIQVAGLPRSGTAWLSVAFLFVPGAAVFHEIAADTDDWREVLEAAAEDHPIVIDVSTYGFAPGAILPRARRLFIRRSPEDSAKAVGKLLKVEANQQWATHMADYARRWIRDYRVPVIEYEELFTVEAMHRIWGLLELGDFPQEQIEHLLRMNIQRQDLDIFTSIDSVLGARRLFEKCVAEHEAEMQAD